MYLARCNAQLGEKTATENNWQRALEAAGGEPGKLLTLGEYAEKNGIVGVAQSAFEAAATEAPKLRVAQQGRLRLAQRSGDTQKIHAVLADMLRIWPNDAAVQNDEGYTRLLLLGSNSRNNEARMTNDEKGRRAEGSTQQSEISSQNKQSITNNKEQITGGELAAIADLAAKLVARNPRSMPHRTLLALAYLKQNRAADALALYNNITLARSALTPSALAVHAAVLAANGKADDAKEEASQIKRDELLPEERALLPAK
jgi:hypothetical protein